MSKLNSPFLNNQQEDNSVSQTQANSINSSVASVARVKEKVDYREPIAESVNEGEIEIKDEGKILKGLIIIMIILLMLSILGLVLYNLVFSKKKEIKTINQQVNQQVGQRGGVNVGSGNEFEMEGKKFKAGSIVIE